MSGAANETLAEIAAEIRALANSVPGGIIVIQGHEIASRIEAIARRAYNEIDSAVCAIDAASSADIDNIRAAMDKTIGDYYG